MRSAVAPSFILFTGRILGTAHVITLAAPRPDGGKHVIEARVVGGLTYTEEYGDADEANGRYRALAAELLDDPEIAEGVHQPAEARRPEHLAEVTPLPTRSTEIAPMG